MPEWRQFDPSYLYPQEVDDALDSFDTVVQILSTALDGLEKVVTVVSKFAQGMVDVNRATIQAAKDLINSLFQQMTQTGIYWLFHMSPSFSYTMTPIQWLSHVSNSLYDKMDEERPILVDKNAYVGAVVVMATSENLKDLFTRFYNLMELFQYALMKLANLQSWPEFGEEFSVIPGVGREPNWRSKKVVDIIPGLGEIAERMLGFANSLSGPDDASTLYGDFATLISEKAAYLVEFVKSIENILNTIAVIANFEGAFVLPIYGQGDAAWLSNQLLSSKGGPLDVEGANYSLGGVFLATGGTTTPVDVLFDLFRLPKEITT